MLQWRKIKRLVDIVISCMALLIMAPFFLLISLCIYLEDRGPVFYRQQRVGKNEKLFTIYKFRSMRVNSINPLTLGAVKHNHSLVTRIGYLIRRFKIDETPQFFNVLIGEMSLIGPRPCLPVRIKTMTLQERQRFHVAPGLSGWAEVNGNVELSWEEQLLLDLWYVQQMSWWVDVAILIKTFWVVFRGSKKNMTALAEAKKLIIV